MEYNTVKFLRYGHLMIMTGQVGFFSLSWGARLEVKVDSFAVGTAFTLGTYHIEDLKDPLIEDFRQNGDDAIVDIEVRMQEGVMKKFKLTSTISTGNMHLFDQEGKIKKYDNPEHILEEFFLLGLEYYERTIAAKSCFKFLFSVFILMFSVLMF
ncbi:hypothetical protein L6164_006401 [Bauhinia variegata]|uniref:Uncharacterized protein n=1 Tax=Bauhinia variegata TaxID=167791 RepID=A0ACB9PTQ1_BAUVA|nr:hypothetical protein L6164_006401 [Bauhinia variegata]